MITEIFESDNYEENKDKFSSERRLFDKNNYEPFVYVIKEVSTNRYYIGSRTSLNCSLADLGEVYFTSSCYVKKLWKENRNTFEIISIIPCYSNHDALILELDLIISHNAVKSDIFINRGHPRIGFSHSGKKFTKEHKRKLSESIKKSREKLSDEERKLYNKKLSDGGKKRFEDDNERIKISNSIKKYYESINYDFSQLANKISELHKSGHYEEAYKKLSESLKGKKKPDGFGDKIRKARTGIKFDDEWCKNISKGRKGKGCGERNAMTDPEKRDKVRKSKLGRKRVYLKEGSFIYSKKEDLHKYYKHSDDKYYDYPEEIMG